MSLDDNSKTYLRQLEADDLSKDLWPKLKASGAELSLWKKGQAQPYPAKVVYSGLEKSQFKSMPIEVDKMYVEILKDSFKNHTIFMKFKFNADLQYFTSGEVRWNEEQGKFVAELNGPFFVTTKRSSCRYLVDTTDRIQVVMAGHSFNIYDISSGGFSVLVDANRYASIEKGTVFEQVELKYNLKKFVIPKVVMVNSLESKADNGHRLRLAFKFEGLKSSLEDSLWVEVNKSVQRLAQMIFK